MKHISLNIFQILFLASILNGVILSILIFRKSKRTAPEIYLGFFIVLFVLSSLKIVLQEKIPYFNYYLPIPLLYQFAFGPLLYIYFKRSLSIGNNLSFPYLYFLPSLLFDILPAMAKFYLGPGHYQQQIEKATFLTDIVALLFFSYYVVLSYRLINQPILDKKTSNWFNKILIASVLICLTWGVYILLVLISKGKWVDGIMPYYPIYILFGLCIYSIGIAAYYRPEIGLLKLPVVAKKTLLSQDVVIEKKQHIINSFQENNYHYDESLTLKKLSQLLKIPSNELSYIINTGFDANFNDFINDFRIKAFQQRLKEPENLKHNFIGLAYEVGFNSKASFYRAFKKATNQTPGEFYKAHYIK